MMIILGEQPLRPHLSKEYALALEWAEAALDLESDTGKIATLLYSFYYCYIAI